MALLFALALAVAGCGKSGTSSAESDLKVSVMQASLAGWVSSNGPQSDLISDTNQILDDIHGRSTSYRRGQIDEALATVANSDCQVCVTALENARP